MDNTKTHAVVIITTTKNNRDFCNRFEAEYFDEALEMVQEIAETYRQNQYHLISLRIEVLHED